MEFSTGLVLNYIFAILRQFYQPIIEAMVRFAPVNVTFQYGGRDFTVSGWASVREMFIDGLNEPMIYARIVEPNLDFEPLLIEDAGENFEDEMPNEEGNQPNGARV